MSRAITAGLLWALTGAVEAGLALDASVAEAEDDFELSAAERALIEAVAGAFDGQGKKLVVGLNIGGVIETASWREQAVQVESVSTAVGAMAGR
jgi:hypothetical protein